MTELDEDGYRRTSKLKWFPADPMLNSPVAKMIGWNGSGRFYVLKQLWIRDSDNDGYWAEIEFEEE